MNNQYLNELTRQIDSRFNVDSNNMLLSEYLCRNTKLKGKPFSFDRYPFQRALVDDKARVSCTIKPSQVGVSEVYQRVAMALLARNRHRKGIYAYPDDEMRKKNVQTRVLPMAEENKAFAIPDGKSWVRSIMLIELDKSFLYITGSKTGDATSTDADFVFEDEYDLHNMEIAALFSSRLQNSDWKIQRYFSTPTYTDFGVHGLYKDSDQTEYLIKCDRCNHWQFPLFEPRFIHIPGLPSDWESLLELSQDAVDTYGIDLEGAYVRCEKCKSRLDLGREDNRSWVTKYPSRTPVMRGWKVNPFSVATRPVLDIVTELFTYKKRDFIRGFKNSVLGEPEDSSNNRIDEALIRTALRSPTVPTIDKECPTYIGTDMGHTCHLSVLQGYDPKKMRTVLLEKVPLGRIKDRIAEIRSHYNVIAGGVDRHPESQVAADIWEMTGGIVVPMEYRGDAEMNLKMVPGSDDKVEYVQINRTVHLDQVASYLRKAYLEFYGYGLLDTELIAQLRNMVRMEEPEKPAVWTKLDPNDHFFHSIAFALSSMKLRPYIDLKIGPTLTTLGFATANMPGYDMGIYGKDKKWQLHSRNLY